ncbi:MAG: hypothetical protein FVQ81_02000 [Candidatus Glassbacteria bacterium]|nr:hypothetical protein [Candidatus Glassbacteria bacterium]
MSNQTEQKPPGTGEKKKPPETAALGDGRVFVGRDSQGAVQTVRAEMVLKEGIHYNKISGKAAINSGGYNRLNQVANINLIKPNSTIVDGNLKPNPHVEIDQKTKCISMVWTRTVGIGFSPVGNLVLVDKSVVFNVRTYFLQDLQAKIKRFPTAGVMGRLDKPPTSWKGIEEKWAKTDSGKSYKEKKEIEVKPGADSDLFFVPVDYFGDTALGLWVDLTHPEIQAAYNEHQQRQKFADRIADTICGRNVLKAHPAIGQGDITDRIVKDAAGKDTGTARVIVYGFKHALDLTDMKKLSTSAEHGDLDAAKEVIEDANVEIITDEEPNEPGLDEVDQGKAEQVEDEEAEEKPDDKKKGPDPEPEPEKPPAGEKADPSAKPEFKGKIATLALRGTVHPQQIVDTAEALGFRANLYTELSESQAEEVYRMLQKTGDV